MSSHFKNTYGSIKVKETKTFTSISKLIERRRQILKARHKEAERRRKTLERFSRVFRKYEINRAILFGSILDGSCSLDSDIDLYVEHVTGEKYWALRRDLENITNQPVDLYCQLDDPLFAAKIRERGELIYEGRCFR